MTEVDSQKNTVVGPDQNDREYFNGGLDDSALEKIAKFISKPWVRVGAAAGMGGATFIAPEVVLAQQVNADQVAQKPQVYADSGINQDFNRITHPQPLSAPDQAVRDNLLNQIGHRSGIINSTDTFSIEYVATANQIIVDLFGDPNQSKLEAEQWFIDQGLSPEGVCNAPVVFNVSGPDARQQVIDSGQQFDPTPDGCVINESDLPATGAVVGNTPDTDPVYLKQAEEAAKQEQTPDPLQMVARMIADIPSYNGKYSTFEYDFASNTFTKTLVRGHTADGDEEFNKFLFAHKVSIDYLKHFKTVIK